MNIDTILSLLDRVHANGKDRWSASCPAHDDKNPSLSIRDAGDRVLLHCFGGCTTGEVCSALGIGLHDLFADGRSLRQIAPGVSRRDVVDTLVTESLICEIATADYAAGKSLSIEDRQRLQLAQQFVRAASGVVHG